MVVAVRSAIRLIELRPQMRQDLVVFEVAELRSFFFRFTVVGPAPQPEVGVVGLARPVHAAAHHRDRDLVVARRSPVIALTCCASSTNCSFSTREHDGHEMMFRPVPKSGTEMKRPASTSSMILMADGDLLVLALVGQRQRDADGVADLLREQLLEGDARLDDAVGRQTRPR